MKNIYKTTKKKYLFSIFCLLVLSIFFIVPVSANTTINTTSSVTPYATLDENGEATLGNTTSQLVITSTTQAVTVVIESGTTDPTINFSSLCSGGAATLPAMNITSDNAYNINIIISASTFITSNGLSWNCIMDVPAVTTITLPETSGATTTLSKAIEIGFGKIGLSFDKPVRLLFPNDKGKKAGYSVSGGSFTEILSLCSGDSGLGLNANEECKVDVNNDLVVWTRHFTKFATFSTTAISTSTPTSTSIPTSTTPGTNPVATLAPVIPDATHTTTITPPEVKLFDIVLTLESALLNKSSDLVARTQFTSFGTVPTLVNMVYRIENASSQEVFTDKSEVTVETEQLVTKDFKNLNISDGKYTLFLTTTYGDSVTDEFKQAFEVKGASSIKEKSALMVWITCISAIIILLVIYLIIKRRRGEK